MKRWRNVRLVSVVLGVLALAACRASTPSPGGSPSSAPLAPSVSSDPPTASAPRTSLGAPLPVFADAPASARFLALPAQLEPPICSRVFVAAAKGNLTVEDYALSEGDVVVLLHPMPFAVRGSGKAVYVEVPLGSDRCAVKTRPSPETKLVKAGAAPALVWGQGAMQAHLDVEKDRSPEAYFGRLSGTLPVAEHAHAGSWEVLVAVEGSGSFVLDGAPHEVHDESVVVVPAGKKHAWKPVTGKKLVAFQLYLPPGPEQRFRTLAEDAGAP